MTTIRDINDVKGTVFDLEHALSQSGDDCNVLFVSSRTLYFIQAFSRGEVRFLARYAAQFLDGNKFVLADTPDDKDDINEIQNNYRLEVIDMSCDVVAALEAITIAVQSVAQAGCGSCGSEVDPEGLPTPPIGPGEPFETQAEYDTYKCEAANYIMDGLEDFFTKMELYDVVFWTTTTISAGTGLVTAILATTLIGGPVTLIAGAVIALVTALIVGTLVDLKDITIELAAFREEFVCALYSATTAELSKAAFVTALGLTSLNAAEKALLELLLLMSMMNLLYELDEDVEGHTITTACICGSCDLGYQLNTDDSPRGTGDLTVSGSSRVLTATQDPTSGWWFIAFKVGLPEDDASYYSSCAAMPAQCVSTPDEYVKINVTSLSETVNSSAGARCAGGSHSLIWDGAGGPPSGDQEISWMEVIRVAGSFTMTITISDA